MENSKVAGQKFFVGELRKNDRTCKTPNENFTQVTMPSSWSINEYSLQEESGVLDWLRGMKGYTFDFPDDSTKKDINLNIW